MAVCVLPPTGLKLWGAAVPPSRSCLFVRTLVVTRVTLSSVRAAHRKCVWFVREGLALLLLFVRTVVDGVRGKSPDRTTAADEPLLLEKLRGAQDGPPPSAHQSHLAGPSTM